MIPEMTDPLGRYWEQPDRTRILIDDTHAVMDVASFNCLHNYSSSTPSGVYPGKMWKAQCEGGDWVLRWFGEVAGRPDLCSNNQRVILVCGEDAGRGVRRDTSA